MSNAALWMSAAGVVVGAVGVWTAKKDIAKARGLDKVAALAYLCFGISLGIFGAEHFALKQSLLPLVPAYMPGRMLWVYGVGIALLAASVSIAIRRGVQWSGLLFGVMMFLFVAMLHLPGAIRVGSRILWTIVAREASFGGGAWVLAGVAMGGIRGRGRGPITVGRVAIGIAGIFFGVEHFLHPLGLPGVPLVKQMPLWVPARAFIDYATGTLLVAAGVCFLTTRKAKMAATYLGAWIVLLVVTIYGPVLIGALADARTGVQIEGLNYFADTLLFGGAVLSLSGVERKSRG